MEAFLTAPLRGFTSAWQHLRGLVAWRAAYFHRTAHLAGLLRGIAPRMYERATARALRSPELPLRGGDAACGAPFDFGAGSLVFELPNAPGYLLKSFRVATGQPRASVLRVAQKVHWTYATMLRWYGAAPSIVPRTLVVIGRGPVLGAVTAFAVQERVQGDASDLLGEHDDDTLLRIAAGEPAFDAALRIFVGATLRAARTEGRCLDFLGERNAMVVRRGGRHTLHVIDFGIFQLDVLARERPDTRARLDLGLERLARIEERLGTVSRA